MSQIYKKSEGFPYKYPENHPIVSIIYLLLLLIVSYIIFSAAAMIVGYLIYGSALGDSLPAVLSGELTGNSNFFKLFLAISSIGTFIAPALLLKVIERKRTHYLDYYTPNPSWLVLLAIAIMLVSNPFLELTSTINKEMVLPDFLAKMEDWMQLKEIEMEKITESILSVSTIPGLLINLIVIAVIPAIGEELLFRGCLQPIFQRWTKNIHLAIWITAIIFSAIHVQFYGFIPRMLMGAAFGYMLYWGKSIWLPIIAHFINNATAVIYTFVLLNQGKSFEQINSESASHWSLYILSIGLMSLFFYWFWRLSRTRLIAN